MTYHNLSPQEKRKHDVVYAKRQIEEWRKFYANTQMPSQKLFAESQINHHLRIINNP